MLTVPLTVPYPEAIQRSYRNDRGCIWTSMARQDDTLEEPAGFDLERSGCVRAVW